MRKYSRKKITLKDVSIVALSVAKPKVDEVEEQARRLLANGWADRVRLIDDEGESDFPLTYTGYVPTKPKRKAAADRVIVVIRRESGQRERVGRIYTKGKWAE